MFRRKKKVFRQDICDPVCEEGIQRIGKHEVLQELLQEQR